MQRMPGAFPLPVSPASPAAPVPAVSLTCPQLLPPTSGSLFLSRNRAGRGRDVDCTVTLNKHLRFLFPLFFTERATSQSLFIYQASCEEQLGKPSVHLHLSSAGSREDGKARKPQLTPEQKRKEKNEKEEKGGGKARE